MPSHVQVKGVACVPSIKHRNYYRRTKKIMKIKVDTMVQQTERNRNNRFVNPPSFLWLSDNSGAVNLALLGLSAGRQANEMQANLDIFKIHYTTKLSTFCFKV